ncbi:MAG TPA: hypothetical protein VMR70_05455 [Flavisolibacter sp.]|nr:hypothetical protein [Flavisolibacter sp.]
MTTASRFSTCLKVPKKTVCANAELAQRRNAVKMFGIPEGFQEYQTNKGVEDFYSNHKTMAVLWHMKDY